MEGKAKLWEARKVSQMGIKRVRKYRWEISEQGNARQRSGRRAEGRMPQC